MALGAGGVRLNLAARTPEAAARMRSAAPELVRALNTAGVSPVHFKVSGDESGA
jgi:preprotein translocase subunit SecD